MLMEPLTLARMSSMKPGCFRGDWDLRKRSFFSKRGVRSSQTSGDLGRFDFPKGKIDASFEQIRQVLIREQIIAP